MIYDLSTLLSTKQNETCVDFHFLLFLPFLFVKLNVWRMEWEEIVAHLHLVVYFLLETDQYI